MSVIVGGFLLVSLSVNFADTAFYIKHCLGVATKIVVKGHRFFWMKITSIVLAGLLMFLSLAGCLKNDFLKVAKGDSAPYYIKGMELIESGDCDKAVSMFDKALDSNNDFARAIAGQALAQAIATKQGGGTEENMDAGMLDDKLERALSEAEGNGEEFSVYVTGIRIHANLRNMLQGDRIGHFYNAADNLRTSVREMNLPYYADFGALDYFMGKALFNEGKYGEAIEVLDKHSEGKSGKWAGKVDSLSRHAHELLNADRYSHLGELAREIAGRDTVDRAEVAALLIDEFQLGRLEEYSQSSGESDKGARFVPRDVIGHKHELEIMTLLEVHIRGLEPVYVPKVEGFLFYPDKPVTRRELALILKTVVEKIDTVSSEKELQERDPVCSDVVHSDVNYDSISLVIDAKLMETDHTGAFRPHEMVDGSELILTLMRLSKVFESCGLTVDN